MVLGVLANHCFPLVLLLQSSREQERPEASFHLPLATGRKQCRSTANSGRHTNAYSHGSELCAALSDVARCVLQHNSDAGSQACEGTWQQAWVVLSL